MGRREERGRERASQCGKGMLGVDAGKLMKKTKLTCKFSRLLFHVDRLCLDK